MDKISEFLNNLKDRITNPFIFSFCVSWIFFNWEIVVALLFADKTQFVGDGKQTIFEFIAAHLNGYKTIWWPILVAGSYTFLFPFFRILIEGFNGLVLTWKDDFVVWMSDRGLIKNLRKQIDEAQKFQIKLNQTQDLNGIYEVLRYKEGAVMTTTDRIEIKDAEWFKLEGRERVKTSRIVKYFNNPHHNTVFFVVSELNSSGNKIFDLRWRAGQLVGTEDFYIDVTFTRHDHT